MLMGDRTPINMKVVKLATAPYCVVDRLSNGQIGSTL